MAKKQQRPRRLRACTYCGVLEAEGGPKFTREHVLPKSLFNALDPQMITVLACPDCQRIKGYGDDDLRDFVNLHWAGAQHPEAWEQQLKTISSTLQGQSRIGRAFLMGGQQQELVSEGRIYLGDVWAVPIPDDNQDMFTTLGFIIRGLYRDDFGTSLPPECPVSVVHVDTMDVPQTLGRLRQLPHRGPFFKGHVVVWWVVYEIANDPLSTCWVICFNDQVWFVAGTGRLARIVDHRLG